VRGLGGCYLFEIALWLHAASLLRHGFRNRLKCHLLQSNRHGFRNRLKCYLLQSMTLSLSLIAVVNGIDYHFHLLQ
jgi:ribosomal protein L34